MWFFIMICIEMIAPIFVPALLGKTSTLLSPDFVISTSIYIKAL
jgi:hypothetical protein